jgi:hypothetical protein
MPRITKAQLEQQVADLQGELARAQVDLHVERQITTSAGSAMQTLHARTDRLEKENEDLKNRVRRGCDRSRSPRRPSSSCQANLNTTCKAFAQVGLWQRDTVVQEQAVEIQRLQEEVASLRRGDGPIGEVLARNRADLCARTNHEVSPETARMFAETFERQTRPVHQVLKTLCDVLGDAQALTMYGGPFTDGTAVPRRQ